MSILADVLGVKDGDIFWFGNDRYQIMVEDEIPVVIGLGRNAVINSHNLAKMIENNFRVAAEPVKEDKSNGQTFMEFLMG